MAEHTPTVTEAQDWIGSKLDEMGGSTVGRIECVFVDSGSGEPSWLVLRLGRLGHRTAVPYELAVAGIGHVWVPYVKDLIKRAPEVDPGAGLDHARELELCAHYGLPADSLRRSQLDQREGESGTSVPVGDGS